jgi:SNF2 family DNA or RNA helicase
MIDYLFRIRKMRGPYLVIVPLSTLSHWLREFERWTNLNVILYHGSAVSRGIMLQHEWYEKLINEYEIDMFFFTLLYFISLVFFILFHSYSSLVFIVFLLYYILFH